MLRRHWGILLALGVAVVGTPLLYIALEPGQPNLPAYEHAERGNEDYQAGGSRCQPSVLTAMRDSRDAASQRERCAKEAEDHRLQSNDLVQQARAADAAQAQARLAYDVAWMVVYGTIAGFLTLLAAGAAAFYARDAARAGKESLEHAQGVSHAELRPWIQISLRASSGYNNPEKVSLYCLATLKNLGRTAAQEVRVGTTAAPVPYMYYDKYGAQELFTLPDDQMESWQSILPGGEVTRLVSFNVDWADAEPRSRKELPRHMCPYLGVHATYALGDGGRGETTTTFQIGIGDSVDPRKVLTFASDYGRNLDSLRVIEGVRGKIT